MSYFDTYKKRLNFGDRDKTQQERLQSIRLDEFKHYLNKSTYRSKIAVDGTFFPCVLEPRKLDETQTTKTLLIDLDTARELQSFPLGNPLAPGGVLWINDNYWMIWYDESYQNGGYLRFIVIKLNYEVRFESGYSTWGYFAGPGTAAITGTLAFNKESVYHENNNSYRLIVPHSLEDSVKQGDYFELVLDENRSDNGFSVIAMDNYTTNGISYMTIDPMPRRNETLSGIELPKTTDNFWLNGGNV